MEVGSHVENENAEEKKEETNVRKLAPTVLDNFSKLTNGQENVRVKSGVNLIKYWIQNELTEEEHELNYALGRLIRGLGSSKVHARSGFFSTFTALLTLDQKITLDRILEHANKQLKRAGSNTKSENADICTGQVLVCSSIIRSGLFDRCSEEDKKKVLEMLLTAGKEKSYLVLASYAVIIDLIERSDEKEFEKIIFPSIKEDLSKPWNEQTLDTLYLLLKIQDERKDALKSKFLQRFLGTPKIICSESLKDVANIIMTIPKIDVLKHPIYDFLPRQMANSELLVPFMEEIDRHLQRPNRNKFLTATKVITNILDSLQNLELTPHLLTNKYITQTLGSFRSLQGKHKDNEMQQSVHKLFTKLVTVLKPSEISYNAKVSILKKFLFYPGTFIFEKITRSKVVQQVTAVLNQEGVKKLAMVYKEVVLAEKEKYRDENETESWLNNDRLYAAHLLVKLLNHQAMIGENDWKIKQLKFLMHLGLIRDQKSSNIGCELAASLKETFFRSLDIKLSKLEELRNILSHLIHDLDSLLNEDNLETYLRTPLNPESYQLWKKMISTVTKLEKKKKKLNSVFHILFLHMGLQLFNDVKLATDSLKELFICYERTKNHNTKPEENEETSGDPLWIEVVIDLFLNLLSHNSHLLRSILNCVFPHLCRHMNATAVHQILSVLDPKNEANPLSRKTEENDSEDEDTENEDDESADKDNDSGEENEDEDNGDGESDDEDDVEDEDADNEDETVNDKLKMALHQVLVETAPDDDQNSIDLDEMSDSEGEKLNEALGEAFKQFKPNIGRKGKKQSKDDEALTHFRVRVLDLVQIYLDSEPSMLLALEIMLPLLQTLEFSIRDSHQKPLKDRVCACLKKLSALKKFSSTEDVTEVVLKDLLNSLMDMGTQHSLLVQEMSEELAECCIFIVRCSQLLATDEATPKKVKKHLKKSVLAVIENAMDVYFKNRQCLTPYVLFKHLLQINWDGNLHLIPLLVEFSLNEELRPFRKNQALELLRVFFSNHRYLNAETENVMSSLGEVISSFYTKTKDLFERLSKNSSKERIREKYISNLFYVWVALKSSPLKVSELDWKMLGEVVREFRSSVSFSGDAKMAYNKLCRSLGVPNTVKMKPNPVKLSNIHADEKDSDINMDVDKKQEKKKHKNKTKSTEKLKLKKEAKEKRLQSLSEGLNSGPLFNVANNFDNIEENDGNGGSMEVDETNNFRSKKRKKNTDEINEENVVKKHKNKKQKNNGELKNNLGVTLEETVVYSFKKRTSDNGDFVKKKKKKSNS